MGSAERPLPTPPALTRRGSEVRPSGITGDDLRHQARQWFTTCQRTFSLDNQARQTLEPETNEPRYKTRWGALTFADLYQRTQRIAGATLVQVHGMTNPEDVDDCLQAGYLKLWQRLEREPDWLIDKPKRYIVQAVVLYSKSQRFSHNRHYRKMVFDAEPYARGTASQMLQLETWIDLQKALTQVVTAIEDQPAMLLAFYTFVTHTKVADIPPSPGCAPKTIYKKRPLIRQALAYALPEYGQPPKLPPFALEAAVKSRTAVSQHLLTDVAFYKPNTAQERALRPLVRMTAMRERRYRTRWQAQQTLEQILMHPVVRRVAYAKAYQLGLEAEDVEDCVQQGCIKLWERLRQQPDLLADKGPVWAGIYIAYSGDPKRFHRHYQRRKRFADPDFDWDSADEYLQLGNSVRQSTEWTQVIDEQVDIARFMQQMAACFAGDTRKLLALYALTTSVRTKDVASVMGIHEKNYATAVGNHVKQTVQQQSQEFF